MQKILKKNTSFLAQNWSLIFSLAFLLFYIISFFVPVFREKITDPAEKSTIPMFRYGQKHFKRPPTMTVMAFYTYNDPQTKKLIHGRLEDLIETESWGYKTSRFLTNFYILSDYFAPIITSRLGHLQSCEILVRRILLRPNLSTADIRFPCNDPEKLKNITYKILLAQ